jgi:hypothetical protein
MKQSKTKLQGPSVLVGKPEGKRPFVTGIDGVDLKEVMWTGSI